MTPGVALWWLAGSVVAIGVLSPVTGPTWVPPGGVVLPILASGLLLQRRALLFVVAVTTAMIVYDE
ncbi:MAG: hypothetical protein QOH29_934, partial [Actinomycetota bacterium]|nr:hypothetical protein [Actinomycetota bacterium]